MAASVSFKHRINGKSKTQESNLTAGGRFWCCQWYSGRNHLGYRGVLVSLSNDSKKKAMKKCGCAYHATFLQPLCCQTRLSSFADTTTNVQAHATHALAPFPPQPPCRFKIYNPFFYILKVGRPIFVDKTTKWIHFVCLLHANTAQWYGKALTITLKTHRNDVQVKGI